MTLIASALLFSFALASCGDNGRVIQGATTTSFAYLEYVPSANPGVTVAHNSAAMAHGRRSAHAQRSSVSIGGGDWNLYVMDTVTGTPVKLSPAPQSFESVLLSADGTKLVVTADDATSLNVQVYVADSKLQTITQLTSDASPHVDASISADGTKVAYDDGNGTIYTIPATGGTATAISTPSVEDPWGPVFTPDGKKIVFTGWSSSADTSFIYSMNLDGTGLTQLSKGTIWDGYPSVSADGTKITFERDSAAGEGQDIAVMGIAGESAATPVTMLTTNGYNWNPIFAGNKIVFISWQNQETNQIYDMNVDGTNVVQLTNTTLNEIFNPWEWED